MKKISLRLLLFLKNEILNYYNHKHELYVILK